MKKDIQRGEGCNCDVLQESSETGSAHVKRVTPLQTKAQQMKSAVELGINEQREKSTSRKRADKEVKPL